MIKLFGWEKQMEDRLDAKRAEELAFVKRKKLLGIVTTSLTYVKGTEGSSLLREGDPSSKC